LNQPMFRMMRYFSPERTILSDLLQQKDMPLKHMIDLDEQAMKIIVIPRELTTSDLVEMRRIVDSVQPEGTAMAITGMSYIMEDLNQNMITNLKNTLIASTVVMFILLFITFGGVFPVLISLVPILTTTWFLYGFLGISGLSLTLLTAVVFSISIGIGIDYAIHLSSVALKLGDIGKAFDYAARPIMANALGLALGMTALVWTPLSIHLDVSIMTWVSMLLSMFLSLTLLPTMLRGYFKWRSKKTAGTS
ncbi:MAG: MMPL family transporter, partial [Candidatus Marinimicrobia bacterium]|nr:MMPL family transporter [Candidatus Neomarinimicrobiota bacterium]